VSALKGHGLEALFRSVDAAYKAATADLPTPKLTRALIDAVATLSDTSAPSQLARAGASTEIDALEPLELAIAVGPDPAAPGEPLAIELAHFVESVREAKQPKVGGALGKSTLVIVEE